MTETKKTAQAVFFWLRVRGRGLMVRKVLWVQKVQLGLYGTFRHPERRKTSYVKKWLI